jgi:RecJ-like exonuclease
MSASIILFTSATDTQIALPTKWEICCTCEGHGKHSRRFGAITSEDRYGEWDEESFADYMAGHYDARCEDCEGEGKVRVADWSRMTPAQTQAYKEQLADDAEVDAIYAAERRMGA